MLCKPLFKPITEVMAVTMKGNDLTDCTLLYISRIFVRNLRFILAKGNKYVKVWFWGFDVLSLGKRFPLFGRNVMPLISRFKSSRKKARGKQLTKWHGVIKPESSEIPRKAVKNSDLTTYRLIEVLDLYPNAGPAFISTHS